MKLKVSFNTPEAGAKFLAKTNEKDLNNLPIGLLHMVMGDPDMMAVEAFGDPIEFLVKGPGNEWTTETVADPVARILDGAHLEPAEAPVKFLSTDSVLDADGHQWAQNRIANRYNPLVFQPYCLAFNTLHEVDVIVVDSGINKTHAELSGVSIHDLWVRPDIADGSDDLGHGTAIAALVAGQTLGMNSQATIQNVRISDSVRKPTLGELGDALDAIMVYHQSTSDVPKIVNVSWMVPKSAYLQSKFQALINAGVMVVAAAGNSNGMCIDDVTPAGTPGVFTVAASKRDDNELFSVFGVSKKIDVYAPGDGLWAPVPYDNVDYDLKAGSSFSAALASGVASLLFGANMMATAEQVSDALRSDSTKNALFLNSQVSQEENRLLHRPDTNSIPADAIQFLGSFKRTNVDLLAADVRVLMPAAMLQRLGQADTVTTIEVSDPAIGDTTVDIDGTVDIKIADSFEFGADELVRQFHFKVKVTVPEMEFQTPDIYFFLLAPSATFADVRPMLEDLSASSSFNFLEEEIGSKKG